MVAVRRRQMGSKLLFNDSTLFSGCFLEECCRRASEGSAGPGPARPRRREDERMGHGGADAAASGHTNRGWSGGSAPAFILSPCLPFVVLSAALTHRGPHRSDAPTAGWCSPRTASSSATAPASALGLPPHPPKLLPRTTSTVEDNTGPRPHAPSHASNSRHRLRLVLAPRGATYGPPNVPAAADA